MATTFNWIYLGSSTTQLDPTEGNELAENAYSSSFVGHRQQPADTPGDRVLGQRRIV